MPEVVEGKLQDQEAEARKERRHRAAAMLRSWLAEEDDGYDEKVWPFVEEALRSDFLAIGEPDEPCS